MTHGKGRRAEKKRRTVYAAMTQPGPALVVSALTEADQRRLASRSLLRAGEVPARMMQPRVIRGGAA